MSYMFDNWPTVSYDIKKNGKPLQLTNITLRFKINELLLSKSAVMYEYDVVDGESADLIAYKYYSDATLDWVIYLINNVIDPQFEWPMDDQSFRRYLRAKYGSPEAAKQSHHAYEKILTQQSVLFDGTVIPQKTVIVDQETYNATAPALRRQVDKYTYELELNQARSRIKLLDKQYITDVVTTYDSAVRSSRG